MDVRTSPLVTMADEAERPTRWWVAWIVALLIVVVAGVIGTLVGDAVLGSPEDSDTSSQYTEAFIFGATLLALMLWVRFKERRPFSSVGFRGAGAGRKLLIGLGIGAGMMTVGVLLTAAIGQYDTGGSKHTSTGSGALLALLPLVLLFILQGSTEEAVTRGYMLQMGARQLPGWVAILGSSFLFAVVHVDFDPVVLVNITLFAIFASLVALQQGSLWIVCGVHAGWNYFQGNVFGLPVSGHSEATALFTFGPAADSADLLTGGDFGLEASLVGTAILALATAVALVRFRRPATTSDLT